MSEFWTKNKGKIVAVTGTVFLALGGYLTGTEDLVHAITAIVTAVAN